MGPDLAFDALADPVRRFRYYSVGPTAPAQDVIRLLQALFQGFPDDLEVAAGRGRGIGSSSRSAS